MLSLILWLRNLLYDEHVLPSATVAVPTICVGNLAVGGTGKTPHVEYLIRLLTEHGYRVAVVSRGYRRRTSGFVLADEHSTALDIGDEPMQIHAKFPDVPLAVCRDRFYAIQQLRQRIPDLQVVLLDDAFQYRRLRCGFNILLTAYDNLYPRDRYLPFGRLRDHRKQALRAHAVVVTRCPERLTDIERRAVTNCLNLPSYQSLYFSHIEHDPEVASQITGKRVLLLTGIAHPAPLLGYVRRFASQLTHLDFPDHHAFSASELENIALRAADYDVVLTTEKDYARLLSTPLASKLLPIPIRVAFSTDQSDFDSAVLQYVREALLKQTE